MRVILEIPEDALEKLGELAKLQKRSRKNFMEYILVNHTECAEYIAPESIAGILSQNKPAEGNVRKVADVPKNHAQNSSNAISEPILDKPKLTQEEIKQKVSELEKLKKDESAKKCPGWMNPRKFALTKETKIDELNEQITELQSLLKIK